LWILRWTKVRVDSPGSFFSLSHAAAWAARKTLDELEEKAVAKLGITYGVLRRLGFSEDRVEKCLRSIHGVDLEEAYEWVCTLLRSPKFSVNGNLYSALYPLH